MKKLVIERSGALKNLTALRDALGGATLTADLSANAWGAGVLDYARLLADHGVRRFAVDEVKTGELLRKNGFLEQEIYFLRSVTDKNTLERLMDENIVAAIGSSEAGMALNAIAEQRSTVAEGRLWVDAGRGDGGFLAQEHDKVLNAFCTLQNVAISGIYAPLCPGRKGRADTPGSLMELLSFLHENGVETGEISTNLWDFGTLPAEFHDVLVTNQLLEGATLCEAEIDEIRWLPKNHTVGGRKVRKAGKFATIPVGYLDGLPRKTGFFAPRTAAKIGEKRAKVLATFETSCVVNVTDLRCKSGDLVQFELNCAHTSMERELR